VSEQFLNGTSAQKYAVYTIKFIKKKSSIYIRFKNDCNNTDELDYNNK